jgi:hypothetical protein
MNGRQSLSKRLKRLWSGEDNRERILQSKVAELEDKMQSMQRQSLFLFVMALCALLALLVLLLRGM